MRGYERVEVGCEVGEEVCTRMVELYMHRGRWKSRGVKEKDSDSRKLADSWIMVLKYDLVMVLTPNPFIGKRISTGAQIGQRAKRTD